MKTFECERYSCTMTEKACLLRQKKAKKGFSAGFNTEGCKNCSQGKEIMKKSQIKTKMCRACGDEKDFDKDFRPHKMSLDGREHICRECIADKLQAPPKLTISFGRQKIELEVEVFERLQDMAKENYRPVLYQAAYMLSGTK